MDWKGLAFLPSAFPEDSVVVQPEQPTELYFDLRGLHSGLHGLPSFLLLIEPQGHNAGRASDVRGRSLREAAAGDATAYLFTALTDAKGPNLTRGGKINFLT